jgi:hypothetical protein
MRVSDQFLRFTLAEIVPGREDEVKNGIPRGECLFFCLSEFDALIVSCADKFPGDFWKADRAYHELASRQDILGFTWDHELAHFNRDVCGLIAQVFRKRGLLGLCAAKIDTRLIHLLGIKAEQTIPYVIDCAITEDNTLREVFTDRLGLAGTLGHWELVFVLNVDQIARLFQFVDILRAVRYSRTEDSIQFMLENQPDSNPAFEQTYLIPCLAAREAHNWSQADSYGEVEAHTLLSIRPGCDGIVSEWAKSELGLEVELCSGNVTPSRIRYLEGQGTSSIGLGSLLGKLIRLRRPDDNSLPGMVLSTSTFVSLPRNQKQVLKPPCLKVRVMIEHQGMESPPDSSHWAHCAAEGLDEIFEFYEDFEKPLKNSLLSQSPSLASVALLFQAAYKDLEASNAFLDMGSFMTRTWEVVNEIKRDARGLPQVTRESKMRYRQLQALGELAMAGYRQRMTGIKLTPESNMGLWLNLFGCGIHRVVAAANAIPRSILSSMASVTQNEKLYWNGFCIFGYRPWTCRLDNGVMNLPLTFLFDPSEWWRLAHEAGHEYGDLINLPNLPEVMRLASAYANRIVGDSRIEDDLIEAETMISEIFANVFELEMGFLGNWDFYIDCVWRFLNDYLEGDADHERVAGFALRSLFAGFHNLESLGVIKRDVPIAEYEQEGRKGPWIDLDYNLRIRFVGHRFLEGGGLRGLLDELLTRVLGDPNSAAPKLRNWLYALDRDIVVERFRVLERIRAVLDRHIRQPAIKYAEQHNIRRASTGYFAELDRLYRVLSDGEVLTSCRPRPFDIVLALQYAKQHRPESVPSKARVAAILSLWHREVTGLNI